MSNYSEILLAFDQGDNKSRYIMNKNILNQVINRKTIDSNDWKIVIRKEEYSVYQCVSFPSLFRYYYPNGLIKDVVIVEISD